MVRVDANNLTLMICKTFEGAGASSSEAQAIAANLVASSLAGHDSHGVVRVPRYLGNQADGYMHFGKSVQTILDGGPFALLDGGFGFGQVIGPQAVQLGIDKAEEHGVSVIALRQSGHLGRIGELAEMACGAGLVSVHFVNVARSMLVAPFGAIDRRMSTAPVTIGVINPEGDNFVLDFATSCIAEGKALIAQKGGAALPEKTLVNGDGQLCNDPHALYGDVPEGTVPDPRSGEGALVAMGDHKGSGLAMACELLAGALTGSGVTGPGNGPYNGMLSIYINPTVVDDGSGFAAAVNNYIDYVRAAQPTQAGTSVMIPGDPERKARAERLLRGLPLTVETLDNLLDAARSHGVTEQYLVQPLSR